MRVLVRLLWAMALVGPVITLASAYQYSPTWVGPGGVFVQPGIQLETVLSAIMTFLGFAASAELLRLALAAYGVLCDIRDSDTQGESPIP